MVQKCAKYLIVTVSSGVFEVLKEAISAARPIQGKVVERTDILHYFNYFYLKLYTNRKLMKSVYAEQI